MSGGGENADRLTDRQGWRGKDWWKDRCWKTWGDWKEDNPLGAKRKCRVAISPQPCRAPSPGFFSRESWFLAARQGASHLGGGVSQKFPVFAEKGALISPLGALLIKISPKTFEGLGWFWESCLYLPPPLPPSGGGGQGFSPRLR